MTYWTMTIGTKTNPNFPFIEYIYNASIEAIENEETIGLQMQRLDGATPSGAVDLKVTFDLEVCTKDRHRKYFNKAVIKSYCKTMNVTKEELIAAKVMMYPGKIKYRDFNKNPKRFISIEPTKKSNLRRTRHEINPEMYGHSYLGRSSGIHTKYGGIYDGYLEEYDT